MSTVGAFTNILVAVDGSKTALKAARLALDLALLHRAKILFLYVVTAHLYPFTPEKFAQSEEDFAEECLRTVKSLAGGATVSVMSRIERAKSSVADTICRLARNEGFDLIVMGTRGRSVVGRLLLGSSTSHVLSCAPCPVLVVR